ncbi:MAG TPA: 2-C-methyl-D-erythritol 4-phosphate cytidylyltransferase [Longimicrobiales bacterium]|nr:2-C-methyl-D-erythritol 4-phosphate cytidylyltransferase [Longimicrobiales bacterium]
MSGAGGESAGAPGAPARVAAVIPAGGAGRRMGGARKPWLELAGEPILRHALAPFLARSDVAWVIVALPADDVADPPAWLAGLDARVRLVAGGAERGDSVAAGLAAVPEEADVVVVHDAARPLLTGAVLERVLRAAAAGEAAIAAMPAADTVKEVDAGGRIVATLERSRLWLAQTPQAFPRALLVRAYGEAARDGALATDCAGLVERLGVPVRVVEGDAQTLTVTRPADVPLAEALLAARAVRG